jgi:hypothetical protein
MTLKSQQTVKAAPMKLLFTQGPNGSSSSSALKLAERHLCWLCNLLHWLQKAENTQNRPKKREEWFPVAPVLSITNFPSLFPKNPTKFGKVEVSFAKISKRIKKSRSPPKRMRQLLFRAWSCCVVLCACGWALGAGPLFHAPPPCVLFFK